MNLFRGLIAATIIGTIMIVPQGVQAKTFTQSNSEPTQSVRIASTPPEEVIDDWTDFFFQILHPEMEGKTIQPDQQTYIQEWNAMRRVIQEGLVWTDISCPDEPPRYEWVALGVGEDLGDAIFFVRHPELKGKPIREGETALTREWQSLVSRFSFGAGCY